MNEIESKSLDLVLKIELPIINYSGEYIDTTKISDKLTKGYYDDGRYSLLEEIIHKHIHEWLKDTGVHTMYINWEEKKVSLEVAKKTP